MKAKDLVNLIVFLGIIGGCKKGFETKYDFIAFREKDGYHIFPTGTNNSAIGIGYDFDYDGTIDSLYVQATGEGFNKNSVGIKTFWDRWNVAFQMAKNKGSVQYVQ